MRLETVEYKPSKNSPWFRGILVNEGDGPILDNKGQPVREVWDYRKDHRFVVELNMEEVE